MAMRMSPLPMAASPLGLKTISPSARRMPDDDNVELGTNVRLRLVYGRPISKLDQSEFFKCKFQLISRNRADEIIDRRLGQRHRHAMPANDCWRTTRLAPGAIASALCLLFGGARDNVANWDSDREP